MSNERITTEKLQRILAAHRIWLNDANAEGAARADLSGCNLSMVDLSGARLDGAYLSGVDLSGANLSGCNLFRANLCGANLFWANLYGARLDGAGGVLYVMVQWSDHGECGRQLLYYKNDTMSEPLFRCGCFLGNADKLKEYITRGDSDLAASRTVAMQFCLDRWAEMEAKRAKKEAK